MRIRIEAPIKYIVKSFLALISDLSDDVLLFALKTLLREVAKRKPELLQSMANALRNLREGDTGPEESLADLIDESLGVPVTAKTMLKMKTSKQMLRDPSTIVALDVSSATPEEMQDDASRMYENNG